ncbi:MAG: trigger factor [Rhizobiaceae bacterium]|nr:trigger factor [Rhizobiaceae bacterium]
MQVTETVNEGLQRELKITVPKADMVARLNERLDQMKSQVQINGFRQGKVPTSHLKKVYGEQAMAEIVNDFINNRSGEVLKEREERPAQQPEISMTEDEAQAKEILAGNADFEYTMSYEVMPEINAPELEKLKIDRPVAETTEKEVEEQVERIAESARQYEEKKGKSADGDRITMNYLGKIDGEPFEGGADDNAQLILGSGQFIPGFEDQLVGKKADDETVVKVSFPDDYSAAQLAGKNAEFDVKVIKVEKPSKLEINDELAKQLGVETADQLREVVRGQIESQYGSFTRAKVKRQVLDLLDEKTEMELPKKMVEQEFTNIWGQVEAEMERSGKSFEDEDTTEKESREEYQKLAERRVRVGLVLADIGEKAEIQVSEEEMQAAVYKQIQQYPGQEQEVMDYFKNHSDAIAGLRAPIYEDKVIDFIMEKAEVTDKKVSKEELMKEDDDDDIKS